mmetsp:Transcript_72139/g.169047  ORF Transcript_72139/g.169047 Transcript_72139/m.169047 type:complete len:282 (+) Transcript_72139:88-933(+)|eukprot:s1935_g2.t1
MHRMTLAALYLVLLATTCGTSSSVDDVYEMSLLQVALVSGRGANSARASNATVVDPEHGICVPSYELDKAAPMEEVMAQHEGQDGWCVFGAMGEWSSLCAVARREESVRGFTDYFEMYYKLLLPPMKDQKTFRLPDGSSLAIRDKVYPLDDIYCWVNGWYYASYEKRKALVNNFTYLEEVSEPFCRSLEESVPNYHRISVDDATDETSYDMKALEAMWAAPDAVAQINQTVVEGMKLHAAFKCIMAGGKGALCDIANCARRGCLLGNNELGYTARGECPDV